ncbi:hypothetical protein LRB11_14475 [Ectothiorhodospira haloalkaliphila]|uniref:hypothetical protein n=1 Tax=Ectothiorhodospira haloalkaliphila TaxID=421628 RepID=UPI001EE796DC|nr:hypothetical protein [Ectothiorhodospira haloalkaliphila]MCG5526119.1 hypothetical protein [Ectothiorhodospira haloalkaliphila]
MLETKCGLKGKHGAYTVFTGTYEELVNTGLVPSSLFEDWPSSSQPCRLLPRGGGQWEATFDHPRFDTRADDQAIFALRGISPKRVEGYEQVFALIQAYRRRGQLSEREKDRLVNLSEWLWRSRKQQSGTQPPDTHPPGTGL